MAADWVFVNGKMALEIEMLEPDADFHLNGRSFLLACSARFKWLPVIKLQTQ
ncbi:MAG: hypothetical protein WB679_26735 [Terracidiphilus sp.]